MALPAVAAGLALLCAAFIGWDAVKRPRPERLAWTIAFLVFAVAALAEVLGQTVGWSAELARVYYLAGAVLVVGILALGELYLFRPERMPVVTPGVALLVAAVAATAVWSAPVDPARLPTDGWRAIERGPFLVALTATINVGGTLVLVGGALTSAWKLRRAANSRRRAAGCVLIAVGTIVVAFGGTLTRFGQPDLLYLAMAFGVAIIFAGVLLTRQTALSRSGIDGANEPTAESDAALGRPRLVSMPKRAIEEQDYAADEGVRYVTEQLLPLGDAEILEACRRWSAKPFDGTALTREQARQVWRLRVSLPAAARPRFDALPLPAQAQLAELYDQVWGSDSPSRERRA